MAQLIFSPEGAAQALAPKHGLPGTGASQEEFTSGARRAANEHLSIRDSEFRRGAGFRAYGPLNQGYGVTVLIIGDKIENAWPVGQRKLGLAADEL